MSYAPVHRAQIVVLKKKLQIASHALTDISKSGLMQCECCKNKNCEFWKKFHLVAEDALKGIK